MTIARVKSANSFKDPSPGIWSDLPDDWNRNPGSVRHIWDDFLGFNGLLTTTSGDYSSASGGWASYQDSGGTITQLATERDGVIRLTTDTTDNDENWLQLGGATGVHAVISDTAGDALKLWFEARVRLSLVTIGNYFVGLAEEGLAAADTITDAGAMASKDFIGWNILEADSDGWDTTYRKAGQTQQVVGNVAHAAVADTWVKLGFKYEPDHQDGARVTFFVNGVPESSYVTAANIAADTFPDGEEMSILFGHKNSSGALTTLDIDWVRFAQIRQ